MKRLILSSAVLLLAVGTAAAADLAPYYPPPPPPPPPPMWTGPFLGGSIGGSFGNSGNSVSGKDLYCTGVFCPTPLVEQDFIVPGAKSDGGSVAGGAQLGYNFQFDSGFANPSFVIGGVVDFTALDRSGSSSGMKTFGPVGNITETDAYTDSFKHDWLATLRLRVGPTFDNLWIYGTGGLAIGGLNSSSSSVTTWTDPYAPWSPGIAASGQGSTSGTALGFAVGAGAEYRLTPNWSIFGEYLYYSLSKSYTVLVNENGALTGTSDLKSYGVKANVDGNLVKFGVNYAFWGY